MTSKKNPRYRGFGQSAGYPKMRGQDGRRATRPLGSMKGGGKPPNKGCKGFALMILLGTFTTAVAMATWVTQLVS